MIVSICFALRQSNSTGSYGFRFSDLIYNSSGQVVQLLLRESKSGRKVVPFFDKAFSELRFQENLLFFKQFCANPALSVASNLQVSSKDVSILLKPLTSHSLRVCAAKRMQQLNMPTEQTMALGAWSHADLANYYALAHEE